MKLIVMRFIAVLLLVIPGLLATYGFLEIKNALFDYFSAMGNAALPARLDWLKLIIGVLSFGGGVAFIGGWIFFRDRRNNYVASRFKAKRRN